MDITLTKRLTGITGQPIGRVIGSLNRRRKRKPPLLRAPNIANERFAFIGGLHRSGTSILHRLLNEHAETSGFTDTGVPQDEGQHLQSVFPAARVHGGPGKFAYDFRSHLTEASAYATAEARDRLLREWGAYHDLTKPVLLEKSPPNLIRSRYFQALFPGASFIFLVRHPIPVALATQKWSGTPVVELVLHWFVAHSLMLDDLASIHNYALIRYEDLVTSPSACLDQICDLTNVRPFTAQEEVVDHNSTYFARWQEEHREEGAFLETLLGSDHKVMTTLGYSFSDPFVGYFGA